MYNQTAEFAHFLLYCQTYNEPLTFLAKMPAPVVLCRHHEPRHDSEIFPAGRKAGGAQLPGRNGLHEAPFGDSYGVEKRPEGNPLRPELRLLQTQLTIRRRFHYLH